MAASEACDRTCALVRLAASAAMSASRMRDWAAEVLAIWELARLVAYCRLFSPAPTMPWALPRLPTAVLIDAMARRALPAESILAPVRPRPAMSTACPDMATVTEGEAPPM